MHKHVINRLFLLFCADLQIQNGPLGGDYALHDLAAYRKGDESVTNLTEIYVFSCYFQPFDKQKSIIFE